MPYLLPKKYLFRHNYCFFLHDLMVKIVKSGEERKAFGVNIHLRKEEFDQFKDLSGEKSYEWLINNNHKREADLLIYKQIFVATLSDFLQFIFFSLKSSEKGQLTVTYSLLRKPFKDNLYIFESLLNNPNEFIEKFNSDKSYDKIATDSQSEEIKRKLIADVFTKLPVPIMDSDFIYNLRYSKAEDYGLERLWQKATHIVTSCKYYQTEKGNLNFVFSTYDSKIEQWEYLYLILPNLLFYTYQIIHILYYTTILKEKENSHEVWSRILLGNILSNKVSAETENDVDKNDIYNIELNCHKCKQNIKFDKNNEIKITETGMYTCKNGHRSNFFKI